MINAVNIYENYMQDKGHPKNLKCFLIFSYYKALLDNRKYLWLFNIQFLQ